MDQILEDVLRAALSISWFVCGYFMGLHSKAKETHIYHHGEEVETIEVTEENYNPSIPDPDYQKWYDANK